MARVLVGTSNKGGKTTTTTALNLGACFAETGKDTLLVDFTKQGNLSFISGARDPKWTLADHFLHNVPLSDIMVKPYPDDLPHLWVIPSDRNLVQVAKQPDFAGDAFALSKALMSVWGSLDYIYVDPPGDSIDWFAYNAYTVCDDAIVVTPPGVLETIGARDAIEILHEVKNTTNPRIRLAKLLITKWEAKWGFASTVIESIRKGFTTPEDDGIKQALLSLQGLDELGLHHNDPFLKSRVRYNRMFAADQAAGLPAILSPRNRMGAQDYRAVAEELSMFFSFRPVGKLYTSYDDIGQIG